MKTRLAIRSMAGLVLFTITLCSFSQVSVAQTAYTPEQLLVGKWQQQIGPYVTESVLTANHRFTSVTYDQFTRFYSWGRWEIKNGLLVSYFENWYPRNMKNLYGLGRPIRMPEWESTWINFLDYDRLQTKTGIAYRVR